jgi:hypothetical protein
MENSHETLICLNTQMFYAFMDLKGCGFKFLFQCTSVCVKPTLFSILPFSKIFDIFDIIWEFLAKRQTNSLNYSIGG